MEGWPVGDSSNIHGVDYQFIDMIDARVIKLIHERDPMIDIDTYVSRPQIALLSGKVRDALFSGAVSRGHESLKRFLQPLASEEAQQAQVQDVIVTKYIPTQHDYDVTCTLLKWKKRLYPPLPQDAPVENIMLALIEFEGNHNNMSLLHEITSERLHEACRDRDRRLVLLTCYVVAVTRVPPLDTEIKEHIVNQMNPIIVRLNLQPQIPFLTLSPAPTV
jgi:hypothetical protein